jgi:CDP-2,3-bis-(O-geranylgeranyl)-sn-glycerol synthase
MMTTFLETLWIFLPAMAANMAPVFAARYNWLSVLDKPLDGHLCVRGRRVLGDNKTIRGLVVGVLFGALFGYIQSLLYTTTQWAVALSLVSYASPVFAMGLGGLLGFGALVGDAIKSCIKRGIDIAPGKQLPAFDQIDFVLGASAVAWMMTDITITHIAIALMTIGVGSFVISYIGVALRIKKSL